MNIEQQKNLRNLTTLKVGGDAEYFVEVTSEADVIEAVAYAQAHDLAITVLSGGSNVLVSDDGIKGLVMHMCITGITTFYSGETADVSAFAGESLDDVVLYAVENGLWGIENLSHIPGSVGATPVQNVGAYGVEVSHVIKTVRAYNCHSHTFDLFTNASCAFGYRDSFFKTVEGKKYIITSVTFSLSKNKIPKIEYVDLKNYFKDEVPTLIKIREVLISIRKNKFPNWHEIGTAGSFFKNPIIGKKQYALLVERYEGFPGYDLDENTVKLSLGWILDKTLHLKGYTAGTLSLYEKQALVLIAGEGSTALTIEQFANDIITKVKDETGVDVQWEVTKLQ